MKYVLATSRKTSQDDRVAILALANVAENSWWFVVNKCVLLYTGVWASARLSCQLLEIVSGFVTADCVDIGRALKEFD